MDLRLDRHVSALSWDWKPIPLEHGDTRMTIHVELATNTSGA